MAKGGPHTGSTLSQMRQLQKAFSGSNFYNAADDLASSLELSFDDGLSVEFWLKKEAFSPSDRKRSNL